MLKRKIIVIGGSAAGPAAAAKAKRVNAAHDVIIYESGGYISVGTCEIPYVLSGEIKDYRNIIFYDPKTFEKEKGVVVKLQNKVEAIDKVKRKITVKNLVDGRTFEDIYDKLILCTGSTSRVHPAFRQGLKNVFYLKTIDDLLKIQSYVDSNTINDAIIIGGGFTGMEALDFVKKISRNVLIVDKKDSPLHNFEEEIQKIVLENVITGNCNFIGNVSEIKVFEKVDKVQSLLIGKEKYETDFVLITTGFEPNTTLAEMTNLSLHTDRSICVDNRLQTSDDNIFAAGDCISVKDFITKRPLWLPLASLSHIHGHIAGANAAGEKLVAKPVVRNIALKVGEFALSMVGLNGKELAKSLFKYSSFSTTGNSRIKIMPNGVNHYAKIFAEKKTKKILGANLIGGEDIVGRANLISFAIQNGITVDKLHSVDYAYTPTLSPFVETLSVIGKKSEESNDI